MAVTFDELTRLEKYWVEFQLEFGLTHEQIARNLGYKLVEKK